MERPGSDQSLRDKNCAIARKHGDAEIRALRKIYGKEFAEGLPDATHPSEALDRLDDKALAELHHHFDDGSVERRIAKPARYLSVTNSGGLVG